MKGWNIFLVALNVGCAVVNVIVGNTVLAVFNAVAAAMLLTVLLVTQ